MGYMTRMSDFNESTVRRDAAGRFDGKEHSAPEATFAAQYVDGARTDGVDRVYTDGAPQP
jgi:hypothetical protein